MYGTSGSLANNRTNENDSTIKIFIDKWYEKNLLNNYDKFISKSAIYCNDRSINSSGKNFGAFSRTDALTPSYKCGEDGSGGLFESTQAIADKFSASTTGGGNGLLKYPVALMTLDEVDFAGDPSLNVWFNTNGDGALNGGAWQLISPTYVDRYVAYVEDKSTPNSISALSHNVRPVISLNKCATIKSGNGTPESPYEIDETSCS